MEEQVIIQHYIPQFVLRHFSDNKQVYEALLDEEKVYKTNFNRSMSERFTYEHPFLEKNKLEKFFGDIESDFAPAIKRVIDLLDTYDNEADILAEAKSIIDSFTSAIIVFYYRSGALLHEFSFETKNKEARIEYMLNKLMNSNYINDLGNTIRKYYEFAIIKSENNEFLLSDQYISTAALGIKSRFSNISNRHIGLKDVMVLIPLSSKYYCVFYHGKKPDYIEKGKINVLNELQVDEINKVIINNSYVKCVGYNKESLSRALVYFDFKSPASTYMGFNDGSVSGATLKKEIFFYQEDEIAWEMFTNPSIFIKLKDLGRNDACGCNSGKKFKSCCSDHFSRAKRIMDTIIDKHLHMKIRVHPKAMSEYSVTEFFSRKTR